MFDQAFCLEAFSWQHREMNPSEPWLCCDWRRQTSALEAAKGAGRSMLQVSWEEPC